MKPITTFVHGILDYTVGLALIAAPYLFGFVEVGGRGSVGAAGGGNGGDPNESADTV